MYAHEFTAEDGTADEQRVLGLSLELCLRCYQHYVHSVPGVLHALAEDGVVHELLLVLGRFSSRPLPQLGVEIDVSTQPPLLPEPQYSVHPH